MSSSIPAPSVEAFLESVWDAQDVRYLDATARLLSEKVVEHLADWCAIDLLVRENKLERIGEARRAMRGEPSGVVLGSVPSKPIELGLLASLNGSQGALVQTPPSRQILEQMSVPEVERERFASSSAAVVLPLVMRGETLGTLSMVGRELEPPQDPEVLAKLSRRVAGRIDNFRLFGDLRALNERLQAIVDHAPALIYVKDAEGRYEMVNKAFAARLNRTPDEIIGRTDVDLHPDEAATLQRNDAEVLRTNRPVQVEEYVTAPDGTHTSIAEKFPIPALHGKGFALCGISTDITERKRVEVELHKTAEFRERLLGIVSHDLRNPLNAVLLSAGALLRREDLPEGATRAVRRIVTSGDRMLAIVSDLLDFTRGKIGSGIPIVRTESQLPSVLQDVVDELEIAHPDRRIALMCDGSLSGWFDAARIAQLVGNLIKNALRYGAKDAPITVRAEERGNEVAIAVHNFGPPIPPELLPRLFDPFWQSNRSGGGLGLGLYIVDEIVRAHGGAVKVSSTHDEGTHFTVILPKHASTHADANGEGATASPS